MLRSLDLLIIYSYMCIQEEIQDFYSIYATFMIIVFRLIHKMHGLEECQFDFEGTTNTI
jgi:hypothetical protein